MSKRIYLNESELHLLESVILQESIFEATSLEEIKETLKKMIRKGIVISAALIASIISFYHLTPEQSNEIKEIVKTEVKQEKPAEKNEPVIETWKLAANDVIATVYNAKPSQCNNDFGTTASMFRLNLYDVSSHRIIAMERTFMKELGVKYGDVVKIEGTDGYDGEYQIQDTMNKRFAGMHKIDILVPDNIKYGQWDNVKLYVLNNKSLEPSIKRRMAPPISKKESAEQMKKLRKQKTIKR